MFTIVIVKNYITIVTEQEEEIKYNRFSMQFLLRLNVLTIALDRFYNVENDDLMKRLLLMMSMGLLTNSTAHAATKILDGQAIFDRNCSVCHSMNPPPKSAPPIIGVISRYHVKFQTKKDGVNHLVAYLKGPDTKNAVEPQAIFRFGLMPKSPLSETELRAVAGWVWDQYNPTAGACGGFDGQGRINNNCK
jgi:cytochrome c